MFLDARRLLVHHDISHSYVLIEIRTQSIAPCLVVAVMLFSVALSSRFVMDSPLRGGVVS